jgi:glycolate oxidase FAD binding subunit
MKASTQSPVPGHPVEAEERRRFTVDGVMPSTVMRPEDPQDAARGLRSCADAGAAVIVIGGGTQLRLGSAPRRYDVAFLTERLDALLEYEPADMTCRVQAGMTLGALQRELGAHRQWLPVDPPHPERATLGGIVAANSNGPGRARYGGVRDWVIGIAVAYPSGKVARAGGKVVKNVAGYDLMKLHTGALGTLGVIAEVNLKVQAVPEASVDVAAQFDRPGDALRVGQELARRYLQPALMAILSPASIQRFGWEADLRWTLAMRAQGYRKEVDAAVKEASTLALAHGGGLAATEGPVAFWEDVRDFPAPDDPSAVVLSASGPLTRLGKVLEAIPPEAGVIADPAAGLAHVWTSPASAPSLLERLRQVIGEDGQVIVAAAPPDVKRALDVWGPPPPGFPLMRALKQALDPRATLNPGRFVGGL